jgi:branched-chain amino acid transport system ATP-binding protein
LPYAQQRALELGITLGSGADVVLLDEPTAGMSRPEAAYFTALTRSATAGKTLLLVEHDMDVVADLADKIAVLVQGRIIACGPPQAVRADPAVQAAYLGEAV